jgi:O-6-methylguanine DNA methyltransferase
MIKHAVFGATRKIREGWLAAGVTEKGLACLCLPQKTLREAQGIINERLALQSVHFNTAFTRVKKILDLIEGYFEGDVKHFPIPLDPANGSAFDRRVWEGASRIAYGEIKTYAWLGAMIGKPGSARAVGGALGRNPLPIVIPCHRIIKSDGSLGGFGAGLWWKRRLLELEAQFR